MMKTVLLTIAAFIFVCVGVRNAVAAPIVLELFTSQGCSSCPAADAVLEELANEKSDLIPLSFHVNYWDYIGWKDPFATDITTQRQYDYARAMDHNGVFTPQLIINGEYSVNGADKDSIDGILKNISENKKAVMTVKDGKIFIPAIDKKITAQLEDVAYIPSADTHVERGENSDRDLHNINIVRSIKYIGTWDGSTKSFTLPVTRDDMKHVLILQRTGDLHILSARRL